MTNQQRFMQEAIQSALQGMHKNGGGPFGAVVVKGEEIIARGNNRVTATNDPTAHAEIMAIREACKKINSFQLTGCDIYTSCEPCPMCLGAIYWARPDHLYYACTKEDAAAAGFDDEFIYREINLPHPDRSIPFISISQKQALVVFEDWVKKSDKTPY